MWTSRLRLFCYKIVYADISHQGKAGLLICAQHVAVRLHVCPTYTILNTPKCKTRSTFSTTMIQEWIKIIEILCQLIVTFYQKCQHEPILKDQATFANIGSWIARPALHIWPKCPRMKCWGFGWLREELRCLWRTKKREHWSATFDLQPVAYHFYRDFLISRLCEWATSLVERC